MEAFFTFWSANELRRTFFSHLAHAAAQRQTTTETVVNVLFAHYGGYACDEKAATRMCCPWSVLSFLDRPSRGFLPYWFATGAPSRNDLRMDTRLWQAGYLTAQESTGDDCVRLVYPNLEVARSPGEKRGTCRPSKFRPILSSRTAHCRLASTIPLGGGAPSVVWQALFRVA